ncbi:MAG: Hpt domain-containing protein, partial [Helicobacteraceae bacterium]|nr:Hpt domain-containing protein [Helicobacteraceae bacterium]
MTEYQALFLQEASELFANAYERLLPAEESDSLDDEAIGELFRILHTIKGSSGGVDFHHLSRYAHSLENLLMLLRDGKIDYQSTMASFLVDSMDVMQHILTSESKGELNERDFAQELEAMEGKIAEYTAHTAKPPQAEDRAGTKADDDGFMLFDPSDLANYEEQAQADEGHTEPTPPAKQSVSDNALQKIQTTSIRVDLDKVDTLLNRVGELVITNAMLARFAERLENRTDRNELRERLEQLERHIRNL